MPPSLRGGLRDGGGDSSQEYQRFFDLSHQTEGGKTHQS